MTELYKDLRNKNVVVTGGASGLGYAIAEAFVAHYSNVLLVGRNREKLEVAKDKLGERVSFIAFDLNEVNRLPELIGTMRDLTGDIDILVNNAGINIKKSAFDLSNQEYEKIVQTNQTAVFALSREVAKSMKDSNAGSVIMISSMAAHYGIPKVVAYAASKTAVEGMTRALAVEWAPFGIRVNCIAPGFITTPMSTRALENDPERKRRVLERTPMAELGNPSDVANAVLFLASSQARYITGVVLPVDGGNSIGF